MNKKEVTEIKKQFTPSNCAITRICGCYVDGEKEKKTEMKDAFLSLPEEEMFKYFDIFRKSLSGTIGKNLLNMECRESRKRSVRSASWMCSATHRRRSERNFPYTNRRNAR